MAYYTDCFDLASHFQPFHTMPPTTPEKRQGVVGHKSAGGHQLDQDHTLDSAVFQNHCCCVQPAIILGRDGPSCNRGGQEQVKTKQQPELLLITVIVTTLGMCLRALAIKK